MDESGPTGARAVAGHLRSLIRPLGVRDYRLLWSAQVASELGDWATRLALTLVVFDRTRSAAWSAAVVTVSVLPWAGLGQMVATALDRLPRRTVMVAADLVRAVIFTVLTAHVPLAVIFAGAFLAGLATVPFEVSRYSIRLEVTDDVDLYSGAITLFSITTQLTTIVGFALGGALVALVGARATFAVNAGSFLLSAWFVSRIRTRIRGGRNPSTGAGGLLGGVRTLVGDPVLRWCSTLSLSSAFAGMAIEGIAAAYGRGHPGKVAVLAVAVPVGMVVAGLVVPHAGAPQRLLRAAAMLPVVGGAAGLAFFAAGHGLATAALGFGASSFAIGVPIPAGPVVGRRLAPEVRGPVFSILQGANFGGQAAGAAIGGVLAGIFTPRTTCLAACAGLILLGLAARARVPDPDAGVDPASPSSP